MKIEKHRVILEKSEIDTAIVEFIESHNVTLECRDKVEFTLDGYKRPQAKCEVKTRVINLLEPEKTLTTYRLRHKETGLYVNSIYCDLGKIVFGAGKDGLDWPSIDAMFDYIKLLTKPKTYDKNKLEDGAIDDLKDELLNFEIVRYGFIKSEEMTYHVDKLNKI